jgi:hypothetical protein
MSRPRRVGIADHGMPLRFRKLQSTMISLGGGIGSPDRGPEV